MEANSVACLDLEPILLSNKATNDGLLDHRVTGWAYMQKMNYMAAEVVYKKAQMIDPDANKACNLGLCLIKQSRYEDARSILEGVIRSELPGSDDIRTQNRAEELLLDLESRQPPPLLSNIAELHLGMSLLMGLKNLSPYGAH